MAKNLKIEEKARRFLAKMQRKELEPTLEELAICLGFITDGMTRNQRSAGRSKAKRVRDKIRGNSARPPRQMKHLRDVTMVTVLDSTDQFFAKRDAIVVTLDVRVFPVARGEYQAVRFDFREHISFAPSTDAVFIFKVNKGGLPGRMGGLWCFVTLDTRPCIRRLTIDTMDRAEFLKLFPNKAVYMEDDTDLVRRAVLQTASVDGVDDILYGSELANRLMVHGKVVALTVQAIGVSLDDFTSRGTTIAQTVAAALADQSKE